MAAVRNITFANFICRFGEHTVMLDLAEEVVLPAFLSGGSRKYGDSTYSFREVSVENFGTREQPELVQGKRVRTESRYVENDHSSLRGFLLLPAC